MANKRTNDLDIAALQRVMNILAEEYPAGSPTWNLQGALREVLERKQRDIGMAAQLKAARAGAKRP
jgi:hypothetical protein